MIVYCLGFPINSSVILAIDMVAIRRRKGSAISELKTPKHLLDICNKVKFHKTLHLFFEINETKCCLKTTTIIIENLSAAVLL